MADDRTEVQTRVEEIRGRIAVACQRAGRRPEEVELMAVTKTVPADRIRAAIEAGVTTIGENRVQEAEAKVVALEEFRGGLSWHLIGPLQSNKVRRAAVLFDVIETVDSGDLAQRLDRIANELGKKQKILVEVNLGREDSKAGVGPEEALGLIQRMAGYPNLEVHGLMSVPPYFEDPESVRPYFRRLRELRDQAADIVGPDLSQLSMGMSHDFEIAIEEGSTLVRIGTAIFGSRNYPT